MRKSTCVKLTAAVLMVGAIPMAVAQNAKSPAATTQPAGGGAGITGKYTWTFQGPQGDVEFTFDLKQEGDKLTGTVSGFGGDNEISDGTVSKDGTVSFKVSREFGGRPMVTTYTGKVTDGVFKGKSEMVMTREFEAKKQ